MEQMGTYKKGEELMTWVVGGACGSGHLCKRKRVGEERHG